MEALGRESPVGPEDRREAYTVTIASATRSRAFQFRVSHKAARVLVAMVGLYLLLSVVGAVLLPLALGEAQKSRQLEGDNINLRRQLARMGDLEKRMAVLDSTRRAVLRVVGIEVPVSDPSIDPRQELTGDMPEARYSLVQPGADPVLEDLDQIREVLTCNPVRGPRTRAFGPLSEAGIFHTGMDIAGETGAPIRAAGDGIVSFVGSDPVFGNVLVLAHGPRLSTMYGHASRIQARVGDYVTAGQVIATVGNTGRSSAPHLHFEVHWDDEAIDPDLIFPAPSGGVPGPGAEESVSMAR